jgi:hypothetical protein
LADSQPQKSSINHQLWTLTCKISGNFFLIREESIKSSASPFPQLQKFTLTPVFNEKNQQTGTFEVQMEYLVGPQKGDPPANVVADAGRDMMSYHLDLLAFLSGHKVTLLEKPRMLHKRPGTNRSRALLLAAQQATLVAPIPLAYTSLFAFKLEPQMRRILAWLRKALQEEDVVDSFISLCTASELLSNQFEFNDKSIRICKNCGYKELIGPSTRQRLEHFLVEQVGYPDDIAEAIWELRNKVFHGGFTRSAQNERELHKLRDHLLISIVKGTKMLLKMKKSDPPFEEPTYWAFTDPILDVEYQEPSQLDDSSSSLQPK